jgi:hypothetical protein
VVSLTGFMLAMPIKCCHAFKTLGLTNFSDG